MTKTFELKLIITGTKKDLKIMEKKLITMFHTFEVCQMKIATFYLHVQKYERNKMI